MKVPDMFTYRSLLGGAVPDLENCPRLVAPARDPPWKKQFMWSAWWCWAALSSSNRSGA